MKNIITSVTQGFSTSKIVLAFTAATAIAAVSTSSVAFAASPKFFEVPKSSPQRVCYKQLEPTMGWKKLGFINLDHCLRYVSTPAPEDKDACKGGWWFVYGFNNQGQCIKYVNDHGGGGYGGEEEPDEE